MGSAEATNIILSIIALASVAQVALLVGVAVATARSLGAIREQMDDTTRRVERLASPMLASAEHAMAEVGRAAEAVQDAKHSADLVVQTAKDATGRVLTTVGGPAWSVAAAVAGVALSVLQKRRYRRARRAAAPIEVTH